MKKATGKKKATAKLVAVSKNENALHVGEAMPDLNLQSTGGKVDLAALRGKIVVLYFYPKDATPGCTTESHDFSRLLTKFEKLDAVVYGISRDDLRSHERFREKQNYSVHLLSDHEEEACRIFDVVKMKNMYGKKVRGIERSTFVLDKSGMLVKEWRKVKVEGHAEEVLAFVRTLS